MPPASDAAAATITDGSAELLVDLEVASPLSGTAMTTAADTSPA